MSNRSQTRVTPAGAGGSDIRVTACNYSQCGKLKIVGPVAVNIECVPANDKYYNCSNHQGSLCEERFVHEPDTLLTN